MISKIVSNLLIVIVLFSFTMLVYGLYLLLTLDKRKHFGLPFPFNAIYNALSEISIVKILLEYLTRSFYLIYVDNLKSEVLASLCITLVPSISILVFTLLNVFSPVWYLSVSLLIVCIIIPFYMLKSYVTKKCIQIRISLLNSFTSFTSLLSNGTIMTAAEDMIFSAGPVVREIYKEFLRIYRMDKKQAYEFLRTVSGDSYSIGAIDILQNYDEEGIDPTDEVNKICKQGLDIFRLQLLGFKGFIDKKLSCLVALAGCIGLRFLGNYLGEIMNFQYNETLGFLCIVVVMIGFGLCFAFESNV